MRSRVVLVFLLLVIGLTLLVVFTASVSQGRVRVLRSVAAGSAPRVPGLRGTLVR
jgi:hypothetical protein